MTRVIGSPCIGTKATDCVDVCPVDCIHPRKDEPEFENVEHLYIDPVECIDCGACESACPVQAIWPEEDVPAEEQEYIQINAEYFQ
jgi:ferredoxin